MLPAPLQFPHHQSVLRLNGVILPRRPVGLEAGTLQSLLPVTVEPLALAPEILAGVQAEFQCSRLQRPEHQLCDQVVQPLARQALAGGLGVLDRGSLARIAGVLRAAGVGNLHAPPTPAAEDHACQE